MKNRRSLLFWLLTPLCVIQAHGAITNGLAGHWTFDETSGVTVADSSGLGDDGTYANQDSAAPQWVPGKIGNALTFRGATNGGDFVYVPTYPAPTGTFSISAWVNFATQPIWPRTTIVENGLVDLSGPFGLVLELKDGDMAFGPLGDVSVTDVGPVTVNDSVGFPTATWQHVGVVGDGSAIRIYRNGVQVASKPYTGNLSQASQTALGIGITLDGPNSGSSGYFQGLMDDLGIWTNALTPAQMISIFNAGNAGKDLTLADSYQDVAVGITTPPANVTRYAGEGVSFTVVATGTPPFSYQWLQNGLAIAGATNSTYGIDNVTVPQNGNQYSVVVSNAFSGITSQAGTLAVQAVSFSTALIGYWTFDETTGLTAGDSTTNNDVVTLGNYPGDNSQWVAGQIGGALDLNEGTNTVEYGSASDYPKPTSTMTVSTWIWADDLFPYESFIKNWGSTLAGQFFFSISSDGQHESLYLSEDDGRVINLTDPVAFPTNSWQQVAFACDGLKVRLYRNGFEVAEAPYDGGLLATPLSCLGFGVRLDDACDSPSVGAATPDYLNGKMDDAGIWNRGLSAQEINAIYLAGKAGKGLVDAGPYLPQAPVIVTQPVGGTFFEGKTVSLAVNVSGAAPLAFQWFKNGQPIATATAPTLTFPQATVDVSGAYKVRITNSVGSVTSDEVTVTVNKRPFAGLVSQWSFENDLTDSSTNGNDGTAAGAVQFVPGKFGMAVHLDPGNPIADANANNLPSFGTNSWSMNLWFNLALTPPQLAYVAGFGEVIYPQGGAGFARGLLGVSGDMYQWGGSSDLDSGVLFPLNQWAMYTATFDGVDSSMSLYLNGQFIAGGTTPLVDLPAGDNIISLAPTSNWSVDVGGDFDEFSIWNGVLSFDQINQLLTGSVPLKIALAGSNLVISWSTSVTTFTLESASALTGAPWTPVTGVVNNSVQIPVGHGSQFFRLKQ